MSRPVVVLYDGTRTAEAAADRATAEAVRRGLPLRIVHVPAPIEPTADGDTLIAELAQARVTAERLLARLYGRLRASYPEVTIEVAVVLGDVAAIMAREAQEAALVLGADEPSSSTG